MFRLKKGVRSFLSTKDSAMDFDGAVKALNDLMIKKRPDTFNSSWIRTHLPHVYRFIQQHIRSDCGGIDWDMVTRSLDRRVQRKWKPSYKYRPLSYKKQTEVDRILHRYESKLYVFVAPADREDEVMRDVISIALVRIAQKGNVLAKEEIIKLVRFTIDEWIETCPTLSSWEGHESLIHMRIEGCIRCYRYSGTFIGYLRKTLEYAGRGLRSTLPVNESFC